MVWQGVRDFFYIRGSKKGGFLTEKSGVLGIYLFMLTDKDQSISVSTYRKGKGNLSIFTNTFTSKSRLLVLTYFTTDIIHIVILYK